MTTTLEHAPGSGPVPAAFLELPRLVYADDPMWIPEDPGSVAAAFSAGNPWFATGEANLLTVPGETRMAVFHRPDLEIGGRKAAFFGYWETLGDAAANAAVFERAAGWAVAHGAQDLYGPIDFSTYGRYRLRTSAEPGAVTFQDEPYNPESYPGLLEGAGFEVVYTYLSQQSSPDAMTGRRDQKRQLFDSLRAAGYRHEPLSVPLWLDRLRELHALIDDTFSANFAYTPLSWETFQARCGAAFVRRACPHTSSITLAADGGVAAFCLTYPHYGPVITQGAGAARVPTGALDFETHWPAAESHNPRGLLVKTLGVHPDHRRRGLSDASVVYALDRALGRYDTAYAALVRSDNATRRFSGGQHAAERWYALYRRRLDGSTGAADRPQPHRGLS